MNFKRIARALVCLVLVCALVVNISPIKAEASGTVGALIAGSAAGPVGIFGTLFAMAMGVVFVDMTADLVKGVGESMSAYLYSWGTSAEKLEEVENFLTVVEGTGGDGSGGDGNDEESVLWTIPVTILGGLIAWAIDMIKDGGFDAPSAEAPEGYAYYNGVLLPELVPPYAYNVLYALPDGSIRLVSCTKDMVKYVTSSGTMQIRSSTSNSHYVIGSLDSNSDSTWAYGSSQYSSTLKVYQPGSGANFIWSDHNFYDNNSGGLILEGMEPTSYATVFTEPDIYVGDIPQQVQDSTFDESTFELPSINFESIFYDAVDVISTINSVAEQLASGTLTYEDFMSYINPATDPIPDESTATEPVEDPSIGADDENLILGDIKSNTFFEALTDVVTAPFKWIWENLDTKLDVLKPPEFDFDKLTSIVTAPGEWIWEKIETVILPAIRAIPDKLSELGTLIESIPGIITDKMAEIGAQTKTAIEALVVPDEDYLTDKVNALCKEFAFADSIVKTAKELKVGLAGVTTEPPVIYINLGATRGSYNIGGTVPFLDLRWYAEYKPTVDTLISAFLWICFVWRMLIKLPGIISGMPGDFVMASAHHMGVAEHLPTRTKEYEIQRISNREMIRKGPDK